MSNTTHSAAELTVINQLSEGSHGQYSQPDPSAAHLLDRFKELQILGAHTQERVPPKNQADYII